MADNVMTANIWFKYNLFLVMDLVIVCAVGDGRGQQVSVILVGEALKI